MAASTRARRGCARAPIRTKEVVTIPLEIREAVGLQEGDEALTPVQDGAVVLIPAQIIPRDQGWFWESGWQAGERQADQEWAAGHGRVRRNFDDFVASLTTDVSVKD